MSLFSGEILQESKEHMKILHYLLLLTATAVGFPTLVAQNVKSTNLPAPTVVTATVGIFTAFQTHPLVGLGDHHRMAQELDFYAALLHDRRLAKDIRRHDLSLSYFLLRDGRLRGF
jgi:hypothetical protein